MLSWTCARQKAPCGSAGNGTTATRASTSLSAAASAPTSRPAARQTDVLGINGPISVHSDTYIWVRSATLDFYAPGKLNTAREVKLEVERKDSSLDSIVPAHAKLEKLADGFKFTEGPVWVPDGQGYLLFSDPNNNTIYRLTQESEVSVYRTKSGYTGMDIAEYGQPGSNGLTLDSQGRLTICEHGNRR